MPVSTERVLVIDSEEFSRDALSNYLISKGYYVYSASCLMEATSAIGKERPDLVFADVDAQNMQSLVKALNSDKHYIPVVALGETASANDVISLLRAGAADYLLKPLNDLMDVDQVLVKLFDRVRLFRLNQRYRRELEEANKELKSGISELKADQNAGLKVQMKMLPDHDQVIENIFFDHLIKPSLFLSGDFLDYFRLDRERLLFYIADVSGHGASSAFVTVLLKNLTNRLLRNMRRGSSDDILYPDRFLMRVNKELMDTSLGKHLTMFVGIINVHDRTLTYALGAHYPMPVMVTEQDTYYLEGSGMPVGLFDEPEFNVYEIGLEYNFRMVMFSDGILEIMTEPSLAEKEKRLLELIREGSQTIEQLSAQFRLNGLNDLPDDIAILTLAEVCQKNAQL
ncbi:response regulator receiver-modulated signal transduction PP2C family phosphatase [Oleiphilus messinensis]|uniref:Response regulator receiver-modulated signal transduction PP2C family phosphatase n=1 Tax=Oleiphilus messinensis TaxID=141451 RepID=A0A1Y0I9U4_9GAMM|nr:SpoIIE family protein phosphatase [Oleiphilus messinensis]ARU56939.1 response regulator receiver-modulated signal transduction PP2C family phosphatase [Oleiphilus messinensis]